MKWTAFSQPLLHCRSQRLMRLQEIIPADHDKVIRAVLAFGMKLSYNRRR